MKVEPHFKANVARLAAAGGRFLEFVERRPECLDRSTFPQLELPPEVIAPYTLQSWPMFAGSDAVRTFARAATGLPRLIQSIPERIFDCKHRKIQAAYDLDRRSSRVLIDLLRQKHLSQPLISRGDYVFTEEGLRCMEINVHALGGLQSGRWAEAYRTVPVLAEFFEEEAGGGTSWTCHDPVDAFLTFMYRETRPLASDRRLDLLARIPPREQAKDPSKVQFIEPHQAFFDTRWKATLRREGFDGDGEMSFCDDRELELQGKHLFARGHRIHGVVEYETSFAPRPILVPWLTGQLKLFNGPLQRLYGDKRNLAFLSEWADSDRFNAEERALIHDFVPWTRPIRSGTVQYRGRKMPLEDLMIAERERLVIKPARGSQGVGVHLGCLTSDDAWRRQITAARQDGGQIVQEYVESLPFLLQDGDGGSTPNTVVWGLFGFGDDYGGGVLRMSPTTGDTQVINTDQGAHVGVYFEPDAEGRAPEPG